MRIYLFFVINIAFAISSTAPAALTTPANSSDIGSLLYNCYQLECLWTALFGPNNPLKTQVQQYRCAIFSLAKRCFPQSRTILQDESTANAIAQLQTQLNIIQAQASELLAHYQLISNTNPSAQNAYTSPLPQTYTATPLTNQTNSDQTMQQLFAAIQGLQSQQLICADTYQLPSLKEQLALFGIGTIVLAAATFFIRHHITGNMRKLKQTLALLNQACEKPHSTKESCGMIAHLDCTLNRLTSKKPL